MAIEIVDLPSYKMVISIVMLVYQRVHIVRILLGFWVLPTGGTQQARPLGYAFDFYDNT